MTVRLAAPGVQVSQGRLRVDAARAIKKLREYQLVDRAAWVLEGIRAAVAAGATEIELRGDANDIWLGWHGTPWDTELLPRLFDELVSPEVTDEKQHVRLLAAAVNSALGMDPAYIDVYSITAAGTAKRARYTPEVLAEPENELGDAPLRHVSVEVHEPPTEISTGMLVHLRRRASLQLLSYWLGEPPELPLARRECRDIPVPLLVDDKQLLHREKHQDLVRIPLDEGLDGFIAITRDNVDPKACFEVAERGVVLARYQLDVLGYEAKCPVPIRVFVDAQRLPTNVSRSQVRRDVHPITTAERRAKQLIETAITRIVELFGDGAGPKAKDARKTAFSLLASSVGGHPVGWIYVAPVLAPLAKLPLVRNCFGQPRTIMASWVSNIHTEKDPLDADLDPWIEEILWAPYDDDVRILLAGYLIDVAAMRRHARWARQQRRALKKFLAHQKREIKVQTSVYPRARVPLGVSVERSCVPGELFRDIEGEVCVYTESRNASVVLCVDGRELERVEYTSAIPFDAVIDSKRLTPGEKYRGVQRDAGYTEVDRALKGGVIRAVETLAAEADRVLETDMPLIRSALALARELGFLLGGPLAQAKVFASASGGYLSHAQLNGEPYIGLIGELESMVPPAGRTIVRADGAAREELRRLFGARVVSYYKAARSGRVAVDLRQIAEQLQPSQAIATMVIRDAVSGAITLSSTPKLHIYHCGLPLGERARTPAMLPSSIAVVSDAVVPNEKWTGVADAAGIPELSFYDWEKALIRGVVAKLIGEDVPDWVGPEAIAVGDPSFEGVRVNLTVNDPTTLLGPELYKRLCDRPLWVQLGKPDLVTTRQLATENPQGIFYVEEVGGDQVDDFHPLVATEKTAQLVAKLARRPLHEGKHELKRRQKAAAHKARLDAHLAKPEQRASLTSEWPTIEFRGKRVRGFLGVTSAQPEVRVFVENRLFGAMQVAVGYPLVAAVDLAVSDCSDSFETVSNLTVEEIMEDMRAAAPALLEAIAQQKPQLLGEPGPARRLLAQFLNSGKITNELRDLLRATKAFATLQGELRAITDLEDPPTYLPVAAFADEWLAPGEGEDPTVYDASIFRVANPSDELDTILGKLHMDAVSNVTPEVMRLQARRRMARGLMPTPKLHGIPEQLKRPLKDFPDIARKLGHGEVGFASTSTAMLMIHEQGQLVRTHEIDVMPAIQLAVEAPHEVIDHSQMVRIAQDLAIELMRVALPADPSVPLRHNLARAVLARRVPPAAVGAVPLFQLVDTSWIDYKTFQAQLDKYKDIWALTSAVGADTPLDAERLVLFLSAEDIELGETNGYQIINAKLELEQDAKARHNMARPTKRELELPSTEGILAEVELTGNGKTKPRGVVAVLSPQAAALRGVYAHRAMHPFDRTDDVCRWPSIAVIDDERITPDRTWSAPKNDETWAAISKEIRAASELALEQIAAAPDDALVEIRVTGHVCSDVKALREAPRSLIRGVLWLTGLPFSPATVTYYHKTGIRSFVPEHGLAVGGTLAVFTHDGDLLDLGTALDQLTGICHGKLVRMLLKDKDLDRDVVAAHVAHAIALNTVKPTEIKDVEFTCFAPESLEPRQLASLFRRTDVVPSVKPGVTDIAELAFADDGSMLARVVRSHLGERLAKYAPPPKAKPSPPPPPVKPPVSVERPAALVPAPPPPQEHATPKPPPPPPKPHALQPLVDVLSTRVSKLGISAFGWTIEETELLIEHRHGEVVIGGRNARLKRIATELQADSILAGPAIDAVAAHIVSVLNIARSDITDASEMHALGVLLSTRPN